MKRLNLPPTRNAWLQLKRQIRFLEQGHDMLEKKRELLTRVVYERLGEYRGLRKEVEDKLKETYHWLAICQLRTGSLMLRQAALGLKVSVAVEIVPRSSVGVEYPSVRAETIPLQPVGLMWTDPSFDRARLALSELTALLARLGEAENALWRFVVEQRKTRKRVNALKYNIIPRYRATLRYIRAALEEEERETLFQIKRLREHQEYSSPAGQP
jgi:V/A-type H+/Na+-transporting ATPase subunit D